MSMLFMRFPGGRKKALTLSYDDGMVHDIRLIGIMKKNGLKGTFNINSGLYAAEDTVFQKGTIHRRMTKRQCQELYKDSGMEIAAHGYTHPFLEQIPENICAREVLKDRETLEKDFECIVRGMAYPMGTYSEQTAEILRQCGIVYSRTTESTEKFALPTDWLRMPSTCHHNHPRLMELARSFVESSFDQTPGFFCVWGHTYEFEEMDNWNVIEEFAEYIGGREDIWYATSIEIYDYIAAYHQLQFSTDGNRVYNPTATTLYFINYQKAFFGFPGVFCSIAPGECIVMDDSNGWNC